MGNNHRQSMLYCIERKTALGGSVFNNHSGLRSNSGAGRDTWLTECTGYMGNTFGSRTGKALVPLLVEILLLSIAVTMTLHVAFLHESHAVSRRFRRMRGRCSSKQAQGGAREPHPGSRRGVILPRSRAGRAHGRPARGAGLRHWISSA